MSDGYSSGGIIPLLIDAVFMVGWVTVTALTFMKGFAVRAFNFISALIDQSQSRVNDDDDMTLILEEFLERITVLEEKVGIKKELTVAEMKARIKELEANVQSE
jgi:hypothetical protein